MSDDIIEITYKQVLRHTGESGKRWSEHARIAVSFLSGAITSGWLGENFANARAGGPTDLMVLIGVALYARPLMGDDLALLIRLGVATEADEGRMFTWVSDTTLAEKLRLERETIATSARRLEARGLVSIWELGEQLRDQPHHVRRGQSEYLLKRGYGVSRFYVLSGSLEQFLSKTVTPIREASSGTDAIREASRLTDGSPSVRHHASPSAASSGTKINGGGGGGGSAEPSSVDADSFDDEVLGYFLARKGKPHDFSDKERKALADLRAAGYTLEEIKAGIDKAFGRPGGCRHFTLCAAIARDTPPAHLSGLTRSQPDSTRQPEDARLQPEDKTQGPDNSGAPDTGGPDDLTIPLELKHAVEIFNGSGEALTAAKLSRLQWMAEKYHTAAVAHGATGVEWLEQALGEGLGVAKNMITHTEAILRRWAKHGPDSDLRPAVHPKPSRPAGSSRRDRLITSKKAVAEYRREK